MSLTFAGVLSNLIYKPVLRPVIRLGCGLVAIPLFRFVMRRILRVQVHDSEMERDLERWFRGGLLLLAATANMEGLLFDWIPWWQTKDSGWQTLLLRLLLAVGVIESMPDEDIFSILHRGPPKLKLTSREGLREAWQRKWEVVRGVGVIHLRRSSPVFAIMAVVIGDPVKEPERTVGWWCYAMALAQYLIIALITQRDKFQGLLDAFDRQATVLREQILVASPAASPDVAGAIPASTPSLQTPAPARAAD